MSEPSASSFFDVRMSGFRKRASVEAVTAALRERALPLPGEPVPLLDAAGRVLASGIVSNVCVPAFDRSGMDGYAVRAADTAPPLPLTVAGDARPARPFVGALTPGQAVRITTGAPIPSGADAVLMAELAQFDPAGRVSARSPVAPGKHIVRAGEDVTAGREVLSRGRVLRPQDIGLLASLGVATVPTVRRPQVALLVTGNELLPPGSAPAGFQIVDSNSPMLAALVARDGGTALPVRYVPDEFSAVRDAVRAAAEDADIVLVSGGTSVGTEDHAPGAVAELGELAVHGVALRPAGPTGIGFVGRSAVFLLPGNPASCLCAYDLFAGRAVRRLGGRGWELPYRTAALPLVERVTSATGRTDCVRVKRSGAGVGPVTGGAASLSATVAADGFIMVPPDRDALAPGETVEVWLYDE